MKNFLKVLKSNNSVMIGYYRSYSDICLRKGSKNMILFSASGFRYKGILEIDGEDINLINVNCFRIDYQKTEIFLHPSSKNGGEFTAAIPGFYMASHTSKVWAEQVLRRLSE